MTRKRTRGAVMAAIGGWLADRTIRRRWRRVGFGELLIIVAVGVVIGAFLLLLGMQIPWLAAIIALGFVLFVYRELGA